MDDAFWMAFGASLLAALVTASGIYTIRRFEAWGRKYSIYFVCFAAGVLIAVSFLHIVPKSFEMNVHAPAYLLGGFIALHLLNRFITALSERTSLVLALLAASLTTPLGMLVSYPYISQIGQPLLGSLLARSSGALVYVGATHLLPQAEREPRKYSLYALGAGILVAVIIVLSK